MNPLSTKLYQAAQGHTPPGLWKNTYMEISKVNQDGLRWTNLPWKTPIEEKLKEWMEEEWMKANTVWYFTSRMNMALINV